jgi:hypothetical protein
MVYYFTSSTVSPAGFIYVGKDKVESKYMQLGRRIESTLTGIIDEELIKYGLEEDVWFHVDKLSSAHIYLRMNEGETWESIPTDLLDDCAQLTKANSIEGKKKWQQDICDAKVSPQETKRTMLPLFILHGQI